jgi:hypothetical protein
MTGPDAPATAIKENASLRHGKVSALWWLVYKASSEKLMMSL